MIPYLLWVSFAATLPFAVGLVGSRARPGAWYAALNKPAWTPPNYLFPIAWSIN